LNFPLI